MLNKRGQATLFIILGIVLVVIVVLLFYTNTIELPRRFVESSQVSPVGNYVEQCVSQEIKPLLLGLKKQGGVVYTADYYFDGRTTYFYALENSGDDYQKHIEEESWLRGYFEKQISEMIGQGGRCDLCAQFNDLKGCESLGQADVKVYSSDDRILVAVENDNLVLERVGSVAVGDISFVIDDNFFGLFKVAKHIVDKNHLYFVSSRNDWFDAADYVFELNRLRSDEKLIELRIDTPTVDPDLKTFHIWQGDGTEREVLYFAITKK